MCDAGGAKTPRPGEQGEGVLVWSFQTEQSHGGAGVGGTGALTLLTWPACSKLLASRREKMCSIDTSGSCTSISCGQAHNQAPVCSAGYSAFNGVATCRPGRIPTLSPGAWGGTSCRCAPQRPPLPPAAEQTLLLLEVQCARLSFSGCHFPGYVCLPQRHLFACHVIFYLSYLKL